MTFNENLGAELTKNLREIVSEGIVVIDQEQHSVVKAVSAGFEFSQATRLPLQIFRARDRCQDCHSFALRFFALSYRI